MTRIVNFKNTHKQLNESFFDFLDKEEIAIELRNVLCNDETLCPLLRGNKIDVYYRGYKCFVISNRGKGRVKFSCQRISKPLCSSEPQIVSSYFNNKFDKYLNVEQYKLSLSDCKNLDEFMMWFHNTLALNKQKMDYWFKGGKSPYEREFTQLILRENNSIKFGKDTDFFITDMEYTYEDLKETKKKCSPDLLAFTWSRKKRKKRKKEHRLAIIEVKYMDQALTGDAGIISHVRDYVNLLDNRELLQDIKEDIAVEYKQKVKLEMVQGDNSSGDIKWTEEDPLLILALIGHNTNSSKLKTELDNIKPQLLMEELKKEDEEINMIMKNIFVIKTSEIGFGLYEDKLINIVDYLEFLNKIDERN